MNTKGKKIRFLNIDIDNISMEETITKIEELIKKRVPSMVITPNAHHIDILRNDELFKEIYKNAAIVLPDSTAILWASRLFGRPLKERVPGSDLLPAFCQVAAKKNYTLFFLGAGPGIAKKAADILTRKNPGLTISGTYSPPFGFEHDEEENEKTVSMIRECKPDVLFLGLGSPKQEKWSWNHKDKINVPVIIGIGAGFDFISGKVKRAPLWVQKIGMEWFFRLVQEPKRLWKRYLKGNPIVMSLFLKEFIRIRILKKNKPLFFLF
jgi:N-acetylglucosaminyldiphosphoundecaprenol N-acetyl-beta-D-mannosaminyltransferase